ncbi:MAG: ATP-binding protein, partial [Magnetococcus sp. WYHC-3]
ILLDFIGIWAVLRTGLRPLRFLDEGSQALGRGELTARLKETGSPELQHVVRAFNVMAENLQKRDRELREAVLRSQGILEAAGEGIVGMDLQGRHTFANPAATRMLGLSAEELLATPATELWRQEDGVGNPVLDRLLPGAGRFRGEVTLRRIDGTPLPAILDASPVDLNGQLREVVISFLDITQRKAAEVALQNAKDRVEAASRVKSEFLMLMSHELRTPLNTIMGMGDMLGDSGLNEWQSGYLRSLQRAAGNLLDLIQDILEISSLDSHHTPPPLTPFAPGALLREAVDAFAASAQAKRLALSLELGNAAPPQALGHIKGLQQVLHNLLGNAVKFTPGGGRVQVVAEFPPGGMTVTVSDTGIGIPATQLERVFEPFTLADSSITRRFGGIGVGLTVARRLVEQMGGQIHLSSTEGEGTIVSFSLPLPPVQQEEGSMGSADPDGHAPTSCHRQQRRCMVLLVEDSPDNAELISAYLRESPYKLEVVGNGVQALERFVDESFDLVLMDIQMPVMDGLEATRRIRAWEQAQNRPLTPILALTSHAMEEDRKNSLDAGCNAHLTKPIRKNNLLDALERYQSACQCQ